MYKPIIPDIKLIRIRGVINQNSIVIIWFSWKWSFDIPKLEL